ncbi:hypothetical protein ACJMK2_009398, partial [Sinanodonta woodiana]
METRTCRFASQKSDVSAQIRDNDFEGGISELESILSTHVTNSRARIHDKTIIPFEILINEIPKIEHDDFTPRT